ncbi:MAG: hypothetical protein WC916_06045 [Candidatus Woesearchaeota archaeon]
MVFTTTKGNPTLDLVLLSSVLIGVPVVFTICLFLGLNQASKEEKELSKYTFPTEKILTISAEEYCKINRKTLDGYLAVGVEGENIAKARYAKREGKEIIDRKIPFGTEVVVNYQFSYPYRRSTHIWEKGTALISKEEHRYNREIHEEKELTKSE